MKKVFNFLLLGFIAASSSAHDSKEAYFFIEIKNNEILVHAEFPWTLRNALLTHSPVAARSIDPQSWDEFLHIYVESSLVLLDKNGNKMPLLNVFKVDKDGHSHQVNYIFTYKGKDLHRISNTLMFNISEKHINYHSFKGESSDKFFKTNISSPSITVSGTDKK